MKKIILFLLPILSLSFLVGCGQTKDKKEVNQVKATNPKDALNYTFSLDEHDYRFKLLDGWIKFPNKDKTIAFLVANKETKSFMSAGFEPKETDLKDYASSFTKKVEDASGKITKEPVKTDLNGLDSYYLNFTLKDNKDRSLTYKSYLIETKDYFINLAAWTSDENPSEKVLKDLDKILSTFEQLK